jgi:two-component system sensor histidine kinase MprB
VIRGMSLRARLTVLAVATVTVAVIGVALTSYLIVRGKLYQQFDNQVRSYAQLSATTDSPDDALTTLQTADRRDKDSGTGRPADLVVQFVGADGVSTTGAVGEQRTVPVTVMARGVAGGRSPDVGETLQVGRDRYRVWTVHRRDGGAAQVARDAEGIENTLSELGLLHALVGLVGVALAAVAGRRLALAGLRPVDTLTSAAERVAATQDLTAKIKVDGRGEVARLAEAFNAMLAALADSRAAQRRLVEDAGHELRTPLTSLRNNVELLIHAGTQRDPAKVLATQDFERLLTDLGAQTVELSTLIGELVELAREDERPAEQETVDLADVVAAAVARVGPRAPGVRFEVAAAPATLLASPSSLERAVLNVLDNAAKWSPPDGAVQVTVSVRDGTAQIAVADSGPGIPERDLSQVFKRFYRADTARGLPGSGLGLAIVEQIVLQHGGSVHAGRATTGGALVTVNLPVNGSQPDT